MEIWQDPRGVTLAGGPLGRRTGHQAGRALLAALYHAVVGLPMPQIWEAPGEKPRFRDGIWHFSITHTRRHAFCALAPFPVGLDAEEADRPVSPALAEKILSPGELARYHAAGARREDLLALWVLKESFGKLTGTGIWPVLRRTDFSPEDPRLTTRNGCLLALMTQRDAEDGLSLMGTGPGGRK